MLYGENNVAYSGSKGKAKDPGGRVKLLVWDLDNTLWEGTLLEDRRVILKASVVEIIKELDRRGILQSIASKNDSALAMTKLKEFGIADYFLYPKINWNSKAFSIGEIVRAINIAPDSVAFIDDQPFEREEVKHSLPEVLCLDSADMGDLLDLPEMTPQMITEDSTLRRRMYLAGIDRDRAEQEFTGPKEEFLATLGMKFTIGPASEDDLKRAEELTLRTNQLNTTGYTYSHDELNEFRQSDSHRLLICGLTDKFGTYGKIGLAVIECRRQYWTIKLLLMSCRVMSRGVGAILINHILRLAKSEGATVKAEFIPNDRNRIMHVTYKFGGFKEVERTGNVIVFENDCSNIQESPGYVQVETLQ